MKLVIRTTILAFIIITIGIVMQPAAVAAQSNVVYVSADGSDGNSGTEGNPYRTIQQGVRKVADGGTVYVKNGTYRNEGEEYGLVVSVNRSNITIAALPGHSPKLISTAWAGFRIAGRSNVEIRGFEIECIPHERSDYSGNGVAIAEGAHHIRIIDNEVHGCGGGGIYANDSDYLVFDGNTVYNTSHSSSFGNSGISIYHSLNYDNNADAYKNIIRNNYVYNNENRVPFSKEGRITDGNCIILDDLRNELYGATNPPLIGKSLVENNVCFNNGGRGIHIHFTDNVVVRNNTLYHNNRTPDIHNREDHGEITAILARNVQFYNNIVWARPGMRAFGFIDSQNISTWKNVVFGTDDLRFVTDADRVTNPLLVNPATDPNAADFRPLSNSPVIDWGSDDGNVPDDIEGNSRPLGNGFDVGAYEYGGASYGYIGNGGFEVKASYNAGKAAAWKGKNIGKDKVKCDKPQKGKYFADDGNCAFMFKGADGASRLQQNVNNPSVEIGSSLGISASVSAKNMTSGGSIKVVVKYHNGNKSKQEIILPPGNYDYTDFAASIQVSNSVKKLKVQIRSGGGSGKMFIDNVYVGNGSGPSSPATNPGMPELPGVPLPPPPATDA